MIGIDDTTAGAVADRELQVVGEVGTGDTGCRQESLCVFGEVD